MPILKLLGFTFEWHDDKFELVHKNRGITLEEVATVFGDNNILESEDDGEYGEHRFISLGMSSKGRCWLWFGPSETTLYESSPLIFRASTK